MFVKSSHHANIAKKLEERNLNIYSTVMVGMAWQYYDAWALIPLPAYLVSAKIMILLFSMQTQNPVQEDIAKLREDFTSFKQEMMVRMYHDFVFAKNDLIKWFWP